MISVFQFRKNSRILRNF